MVLNICMKFHEDILKGFKVRERHDFVIETATYKVQTRNILKKKDKRRRLNGSVFFFFGGGGCVGGVATR